MSPGEVGALIMFRPAMGAVVAFTMSKTIMKRPNPPYRFLIRLGAGINWLSVLAIPWVMELPSSSLRPVFVLQLLVWA